MTSPNTGQHLGQSRRSSSRDEVLTFLENSPKGRLVYQTGWDETPNSIWQLVKTVQAKSEEKKHDVLKRAYRASKVAARRSLPTFENNSGSDSVNSSISSNATYKMKSLNLSALSSHGGALSPSPNSLQSGGIDSSSSQSLTTTPTHSFKHRVNLKNMEEGNKGIHSQGMFASKGLKSSTSRNSLGVLEEDNDFNGVDLDDLQPSSCAFYEVKNLLIKQQNQKLYETIKLKQQEELKFDEECARITKEYLLESEKKQHAKAREESARRELKKESIKLNRNKEISKRQSFQEKDDKQFENQRQEELLKLTEAQREVEHNIQKKMEEQMQKERTAKEFELAQKLEKEKLIQEEIGKVAAAEKLKLDEEKRLRTIQQLPKGHDVPAELTNYILREDLQLYTKLITFEEECGKAISHISSSNPAVKEYYFAALKVVNTPLNSLANLSDTHLKQKVVHFIDLLNGNPVMANETMKSPFQSNSIQSGNVFIMKLLAYRFIKKSETEITKQKSCIESLATVGIHLCKRFPQWATLVQANFYKMCPFLVPFSFPRNDDKVEDYAKRMGHDLSGGESAMVQTLLDRISGYCTLYAVMVKQIELNKISDFGESTKFFTLGEVWRILAATMRLEPQLDVTATTIHILLDVLGDRLQAMYGKQFTKLMQHLISIYFPKMKNVTPSGKAGSLTRLQIFIKEKWL